MNRALEQIDKKKKILDTRRPLDSAHLKNIENWFKVELTYSSNALEGNTLTKSETAIVIEKGMTVRGKSMVEHLEAKNLAYALDFIKDLAQNKTSFTLIDIKNLHALILKNIDDKHAGVWRKVSVRVAGSDVVFPSPEKLIDEAELFEKWLLHSNEHPVKKAADAHFKFVSIHPFIDGNGRTARLIMNLILIQHGYPPAIIDPTERADYIDALEKGQKKGTLTPFYTLIYKAVDKSLDIYLEMTQSHSITRK